MHAFVPIWSAKTRAPVAYIGPAQNLTPEERRHITPLKKQMLLRRQRSRCNHCAKSIQLKPFASCDADHIVAVSRGGKTTLQNMQLLCVPCHREKSAREAASCTKLVDMCLEPGAKDVYIFTDVLAGQIQIQQYPPDKRTPLEAIENGCGLSLLTFTKANRRFDADSSNMFQKYAYVAGR